MKTKLYLIRHGEAVINVESIIGGMKGDRGLTDRGFLQVQSLHDRLKQGEITADVLISSTLLRARQTAEIIAPALGLPILWEHDLQEIRVGQADGMTYAEAWAEFGVPDFHNEPFRPIAPDGENWGEFMLRVATAIHHIIKRYDGKTIVAVCHGGVIDATFAHFLNIHTRIPTRLEFYPDNASITLWEEYFYQKTKRWKLSKYNDSFHLQTIGTQESKLWTNIDDEFDDKR